MTVMLETMYNEDFAWFLEIAIPIFAKEKVKNGSWIQKDALENSKKAFHTLLPQNQNTKRNHLKIIVSENKRIGYVWFAEKDDAAEPYAFLYEIYIVPEEQGKGVGTKVMELICKEVKKLGLKNIWSHIFGHNQVSLKFHQKIGFEIKDYTLHLKLK